MSPTMPVYRPALQVDRFLWPNGCVRLSEVALSQIDRLAHGLTDGLSQGRKVVGFCGCRHGDGCTTILLCAAQYLAAGGFRICLVDADFEQPQLARRLGLLPEVGWSDVLSGRLPLADAVIESVEDRLALLPLRGTQSYGEGIRDPAADIDLLREHYDLVLADLGRFAPETAGMVFRSSRRWIDAAVVVRDVRNSPQAELDRLGGRFQEKGIAEAGVVDNFV